MTRGYQAILQNAALFDALRRSKSMTQAARAMACSKSAVSKRVAETERALGVQLFQRTTRRLRPTTEGERVLEGVRGLVAEARRIDAALARPPSRGSFQPGRHRLRWPERPAWVWRPFARGKE